MASFAFYLQQLEKSHLKLVCPASIGLLYIFEIHGADRLQITFFRVKSFIYGFYVFLEMLFKLLNKLSQ